MENHRCLICKIIYNNILKILFLFVLVILAGAFSVNDTFADNSVDEPPNVGVLGSEHTHSVILVKIFGDTFDFSLPAYKIKTR